MKIKKALIFLLLPVIFSSCGKQDEPKICQHNFIKDSVTTATCTTDGYTNFKCSICGYEYTEKTQNAFGHRIKEYKETRPTFEKDGCKHHFECSWCGKCFNENDEEISKESTIWRLHIFDIKDSEGPVRFEGKSLDFEFNIDNYLNLINQLESVINKIKNSTAAGYEINSLVTDVVAKLDILYPLYEKANIRADFYNTAEDHQTKSEIYSCYTTLYNGYYRIWYQLGLNPNYRSFFNGYSQTEIDSMMNEWKIYADESITESQKNMNKILSDYKAGKKTPFNSISEYVQQSKIYANALGYDDYLEYSYYNVYGRDYTIEKTNDLYYNIKEYIVPLYYWVNAQIEYFSYKASTSSGADYKIAIENGDKMRRNFYGNYLSETTNYAEFLGADYYTNYISYFEDENYYYSDIANPNTTAYVGSIGNEPFMFMSPNYQDLKTFIHEFGHYNAAISYGGLRSYDIAETQSQGNEMLFYTFLLRNDLIDDLTTKYIILNTLSSMLDSVIMGYQINEVEKFIYKGNFTKQQLEQKWLDVGDSIGLSNEGYIDYLYLVLLNYQGYYISYATSAIASLEIFAEALEDINVAKTTYQTFFNKRNSSKTFQQLLETANLENIFDEDAFISICTVVNYISIY